MQKIEEYPYCFHTLSNGIRLVHRYTPSIVSHCGLTIGIGSRDEKLSENGTAHFVEHCLFKGTSKRKAYRILDCIDGVGGELNAFTTKEETCVYGLYLEQYHERFLELLADIVFHSTFPEQAIEKEKEVILANLFCCCYCCCFCFVFLPFSIYLLAEHSLFVQFVTHSGQPQNSFRVFHLKVLHDAHSN